MPRKGKQMRYLIAIALVAAIATPVVAKPVKVKGTVRADGTYVPPHTRSAPNSTTLDNWSTKPNVNPWTGKPGTKTPAPPPPPKPRRTRTYSGL